MHLVIVCVCVRVRVCVCVLKYRVGQREGTDAWICTLEYTKTAVLMCTKIIYYGSACTRR